MLSTLFKLDVEFYPGVTLEQFKEQDIVNNGTLDCDAIIIAGEMLDISSYMNLSMQIVVMQKYLRKISGTPPLLVCSGNHDGNEKNHADEYIAPWLQEARDQQVHVDGDNVFFGSTLITIFPWWDGDVTKMEVCRVRHARHEPTACMFFSARTAHPRLVL